MKPPEKVVALANKLHEQLGYGLSYNLWLHVASDYLASEQCKMPHAGRLTDEIKRSVEARTQ